MLERGAITRPLLQELLKRPVLTNPNHIIEGRQASLSQIEHSIRQHLSREDARERSRERSVTKHFQASSSSKPSQSQQKDSIAPRETEPTKPIATKIVKEKTSVPKPDDKPVDKDEARLKRMEVFYTFSGLQRPRRLVPLIKTKKPSELKGKQLNAAFLASESLKAV